MIEPFLDSIIINLLEQQAQFQPGNPQISLTELYDKISKQGHNFTNKAILSQLHTLEEKGFVTSNLLTQGDKGIIQLTAKGRIAIQGEPKEALPPLNIVILAMTNKQADELFDKQIFEQEHDPDYKRPLADLLSTLNKYTYNIEDLKNCYGTTSEAWVPLTITKMPLKNLINNYLQEFGYDLASTNQVTYLSSDFLANDNKEQHKKADKKIENEGGILIIDPISLYHPIIKKRLQNSQLLSPHSPVELIVIPTILSQSSQDTIKHLTNYIYEGILEKTFDQFKTLKPKLKHEFDINTKHQLKRSIYQIICRSSSIRKQIIYSQVESETGMESRGIDQKFIGGTP